MTIRFNHQINIDSIEYINSTIWSMYIEPAENRHQNITGFNLSANKKHIIASFNNGLHCGINKLEHYIEPKIEFILPEKWFIKTTEETFNIIRKWSIEKSNYNYSGYRHYNYVSFNYLGQYRRENGYREITFDQFKKYVLKENN